MDKIVKITGYEPRVVKGKIEFFAKAKDKEYLIPEAFHEMCNDDYLAVSLITFDRPELFNMTESQAWVPIRTKV